MSNHYDPTKDISPSAAYPEVSVSHHHSDDATFKKKVWKTTLILSVITIIELAIGFFIYFLHKGEPPYFFILLLKGIVCILTLAKAYYIVSVFMHLGDEIRNFIMTIVVPWLYLSGSSSLSWQMDNLIRICVTNMINILKKLQCLKLTRAPRQRSLPKAKVTSLPSRIYFGIPERRLRDFCF
ncbi:cytochrome C oxidase subunit IV family protein [Niabella defluvii]|nr:cytochrome C oxidase subunit IV family protein [Niabella sp. I65]